MLCPFKWLPHDFDHLTPYSTRVAGRRPAPAAARWVAPAVVTGATIVSGSAGMVGLLACRSLLRCGRPAQVRTA